ncbi:MAG: beta-propeller fold lactonase family protein, partial [bacterium]
MKSNGKNRRSFLKTTAIAGTVATLAEKSALAQQAGPLMVYVGTFSSPLKDFLPTQVDLPPGNGRGIHIFQMGRESGSLSQVGEVRMGTSPSCLAVNSAGNRLYSANET